MSAVQRSKSSWFEVFTWFLLLPIGLFFCLFLSIQFIGGFNSNKVHEYCSTYSIGHPKANFLKDGLDIGIMSFRFWNQERKIRFSYSGESDWTEAERQFQMLDEGSAIATKMLVVYARESCRITFKDNKITSNSILFLD